MTLIGVPTIKAPGIASDPSRPFPIRDPLLRDVQNSGVRFLFDLAFPWCYPGGDPDGRPAPTAPVNGALVYDMSEHADGSVSIGGSDPGAITYAGGGFDLTNSSTSGSVDAGVVAPASVLADIWAPYNGASQRFLVSGFVKLPTAANWDSGSGLISFVADKQYNNSASLLVLAFTRGAPGAIQFRRQTAAGVAQTVGDVVAEAEDFGTVCQFGAWRNADSQGLMLKSLTSGRPAKVVTTDAGVNNTVDFSANTLVFGRPAAWPGETNGIYSQFSGVRIQRGAVENLARSG
ncbi:MAG: hypothetical protein AB7E60_02670, partial [Sphingobium sp.]